MLETVQEILVQALFDPDPAAKLAALTASADLTEQERKMLEQAQARGLKLTHLLLMNLRFERVLRGMPAAVAWFEEDPKGFVEAFRRYNESTPPTALLSKEERVLFRDFLEREYPARVSGKKAQGEGY